MNKEFLDKLSEKSQECFVNYFNGRIIEAQELQDAKTMEVMIGYMEDTFRKESVNDENLLDFYENNKENLEANLRKYQRKAQKQTETEFLITDKTLEIIKEEIEEGFPAYYRYRIEESKNDLRNYLFLMFRLGNIIEEYQELNDKELKENFEFVQKLKTDIMKKNQDENLSENEIISRIIEKLNGK